ncbi:putative phage holin [Kitasatospora purpeofusca]|uniref:putative phage holin n=1 Tax=Kitasatospora purpeofusca TaxID=67352 RepID=UPI003821F01D
MSLTDMGPDQLANWAASLLLAVASGAAAVVYHRRAPWRRTRIGQHVMTVTVAVGLLGLYTVLVSLWPDGLLATVLRVGRTVLVLVLAVSMVQRVILIADAQRRPPPLPDHPPDGR